MYQGNHQYEKSNLMISFLTIGLFLITGACTRNNLDNSNDPIEKETPAPSPSPIQAEQYLLKIDLQEGFAQDSVRIMLNGELLAEETDVTTSLLLGFATTVETEAGGSVELEVEVTNRGLSEIVMVDVSADTYLGISLSNNQFNIIISNKPFGYG